MRKGVIEYPFEHELYPYTAKSSTPKNFKHFGLFKFIRVVSQFYRGEKRPFLRGPYKFASLESNTLINTKDKLIDNETLMWVNLERVIIRPKLNTQKMLEEKAIDVIAEKMPEDVRHYTKDLLGGRKTKKNKKRKTKRNKKRRKTRKI